ncbi:MAG: hypothetical protein JSW27_00940 [Phycisphaerales bacterium]|nr:MAG: hypothetical protein JSW27_00940 [Phycisphaerales bacterium]
MERHPDRQSHDILPACAIEYIGRVTKKMRYRRRARAEVGAELTAHFEDALADCVDARQRSARARELIEQLGDAELLAVLCRRAKKRCRPLWRKVLLRSAQGVAVFLLYSLLCSLPLFVGKPTIRVDYVQWLNEHWRPADETADNAATYYKQAMALYVKPSQGLKRKVETSSPELADYDDVELGLLSAWLGENAAAFATLRKGAAVAHYWPVYEVNEPDLRNPNFLGCAMEALTGYRHLAFALNHEIARAVRQGNLEDGLDDCLVVRRLGRHLQGRGLLVEQLVGIALEHLAYTALLRLLHDEPDVEARTLVRIRDELLTLRNEQRCAVSLDGEKAFWYDAIQRTFTDDGEGGGYALREGLPYAVGDWRDLLAVFTFDYPDRRETLVMVEEFFERIQQSLSVAPGQDDASAFDQQDDPALGSMLLSLLPGAYSRVNRQASVLKTHEAAALVIVALLSHRSDRGRYPASLGKLVETGYLAQLPQDPFRGGPFAYEVTADSFLLYSWGENLTDEGGIQGVDGRGKPRIWADNGDWVFWPPTAGDR